MRVAISFRGCYRRGGVERVMLESANYLADRGHETHAFAMDWDADESVYNKQVIQHRIPSNSSHYIPRMTRFIKESHGGIAAMSPKADVVGGFGATAPPDSVVWMTSVHRAWIEISKSNSLAARLKQRLNPAHPFILSKEKRRLSPGGYRKVLALTEDVKNDIIKYYNVPEKDIEIVANGYSPTEFSVALRNARREEMRAKVGLKPGDIGIAFVANELERKGFAPLLRASAAIKEAPIHIVAVGRLNPAAYAEEIKTLGMDGRVHWVGTTSTVADYYAACDLFALPTKYEAWGLVILEAMACGLPVLTSRLAGAAIAVDHGRTGQLLNDPADVQEVTACLRLLLEGKHLSDAEISKSVEPYRWDRILAKYEQVLADCCG